MPYPGILSRRSSTCISTDECGGDAGIDDQHDRHHLGGVELVGPDLGRDVQHFRHADGVGQRRRFQEVDQVVVERR